ncbi:MAG: FHA domain-containing protein [Aeromicrobium sp.]|uniref:FHA domain-containing protein n=1 Tax=Aeromicrobium sp. TaxID=1871063 RepID=UPI0039E5851C
MLLLLAVTVLVVYRLASTSWDGRSDSASGWVVRAVRGLKEILEGGSRPSEQPRMDHLQGGDTPPARPRRHGDEEQTPKSSEVERRQVVLRRFDVEQPDFYVPISGAEVMVGKSGDATWTIDSTYVSQSHLFVAVLPDGSLRIRDDASTNGTTVNQSKIQANENRTVTHGDIIGLGPDVRIRVVVS